MDEVIMSFVQEQANCGPLFILFFNLATET